MEGKDTAILLDKFRVAIVALSREHDYLGGSRHKSMSCEGKCDQDVRPRKRLLEVAPNR